MFFNNPDLFRFFSGPFCLRAQNRAYVLLTHHSSDFSLLNQIYDCFLKRFHLYKYVARDAKEWRAWARTATPAERREAKPRWIAEGRVDPRRPKDGWLRFSFPLSYNSDLLEVLLLLGEADGRPDETIEAGLEILRAARGADGMWKMVGGLNGKMHADLDRKGRSSPWITYRALLALKRFDALALPQL